MDHHDTLDWLLSADEPALRFLTLAELLGEPAEGGEAARARREIMTQGAVPRILAAQGGDGHWGASGPVLPRQVPRHGLAADRPGRAGRGPRGRARPRRLRGHPPRFPGAPVRRLLL